jgi:hypothetical protein
MAKQILVVVSNPMPGQEDEYNRWYSEQHLDDVLRVPGIVAAQRFKLALDGAKSLPGPYLAIYEMETDDPAPDPKETFEALAKAASSGQMPMTPALDMVNMVASVFRPITERKVNAGAAAAAKGARK